MKDFRIYNKTLWSNKLCDSPLAKDQVKEDDIRVSRRSYRESLSRMRERSIKKMDSLCGESDDDFFTLQEIRRIPSPMTQLSLERRSLQIQYDTLSHEANEMNAVLRVECKMIGNKFPHLRSPNSSVSSISSTSFL
jgi:hypothetical protein